MSVVIADDTPQAARRALRLVEGLAQQCGPEWNVHRHLWRFDILDGPAPRGAATADAANANLIVIATERDGDLPASVKAWLAACSARSTEGAAAWVALLLSPGSAADGQSPAHRFLQTTAREAGQDFFAQEWRASSPGVETAVEDIRRRAETTSSVLLGILEQPATRVPREAGDSPQYRH